MRQFRPAAWSTLSLGTAGLLALAGCGSNASSYRPGSMNPEADPYSIVATTTMGALEGRPTLSMPIPIPGQDTVLIPFSIEAPKRLGQDRDPYTRGGYAQETYRNTPWQSVTSSGGPVRWHNAIVRVEGSGEEWLILDRRGIIGFWQTMTQPAPDRSTAGRVDALVFIATVEDSNNDNMLNDRDATVAIMTDANGRNPRTVTPPGTQVWNVTYDAASQRILMYVVRDTSGNKRFGPEDVAVPHVLAIGESESRPIVSDSAIERARAIMNLPVGYPVPR